MRKISSRLLAAGFALLLLRDGLSAAVNAEHESPHVPADRAAPDDVCGTDRHLMVADARPPRPAPRAVDAAEESGGTPARAAFAASLQFTGSDYTLTISASGLVANLVVPASVAGTLAMWDSIQKAG